MLDVAASAVALSLHYKNKSYSTSKPLPSAVVGLLLLLGVVERRLLLLPVDYLPNQTEKRKTRGNSVPKSCSVLEQQKRDSVASPDRLRTVHAILWPQFQCKTEHAFAIAAINIGFARNRHCELYMPLMTIECQKLYFS